MDTLLESIRGRPDLQLFLDYDGTLSEIVPDPSRAFLSPEMRAILGKVASICPVAIVTGRKEATIRDFLAPLDERVILATSHGLEIFFPGESDFRVGQEFLAPLQAVKSRVQSALPDLPQGVRVEDNALSVSVHYRQVEGGEGGVEVGVIEQFVDNLSSEFPTLRKTIGKCVFEFRPRLDWDKGKAVQYILDRKFIEKKFPIYLGDDVTDEDAFLVVNQLGGISVQIGNHKPHTHAKVVLPSVDHVQLFLHKLAETHAAPDHVLRLSQI